MQDQLNNSAITAKNKQHQVSYESTKDNTRLRDNTSLKRQLIYQTDIQMKMGQINKVMDEEFETLDNAMEYLKLKQPHQLGMDVAGLPQGASPKSKTKKQHHVEAVKQMAGRIESVMKSDSLNYISIIKSSRDLID